MIALTGEVLPFFQFQEKIIAKVIINRLSKAVYKTLKKEQAGFRKGRNCTEQIFVSRNIIEQSAEWQQQRRLHRF